MNVAEICEAVTALYKEKKQKQKLCQAMENCRRDAVAIHLGYSAQMVKKKRERIYAQAKKLIDDVVKKKKDHALAGLIMNFENVVSPMRKVQEHFDEEAERLVKLLPCWSWCMQPEQKGFKAGLLTALIGAAGDLSNYPNPGKLKKRMGLAPYSYEGKTKSGSAWCYGIGGRLPACEFVQMGYDPKRRSTSWLIGDRLMKARGFFRQIYDREREKAAGKHPDWPELRCKLHANRLCAWELILRLWCVWNNKPLRQLGCDDKKDAADAA